MRPLILMTLLSGLFLASPGHASLRLDQSVAQGPVSGLGKTKLLRAYREDGSCTNWEYMPGYLLADVIGQTTNYGVSTIAGKRYQNYITQIFMRAQPSSTEGDEAELRKLIAAKVNGLSDCRHRGITADQIKLSAIDVQIDSSFKNKIVESNVDDRNSSATDGSEGSSGTLYDQINVPMPPGTKSAKFNAFSQIDFSEIMDASNASTWDKLKKSLLASKTGLVRMTTLAYQVPGILAKVDAHLRFDSEISASFTSAVKDLGCQKKSSSKADFIATPIVTNEGSMECSSKLITNFLGGEFKDAFIWDLGSLTDEEGHDIMLNVFDDKGHSRPSTLRDYVKATLFLAFMQSKFDISFDEANRAIFEVKKGKDGTSKLTAHVDNAYLMNFKGTMTIRMPIMAKDLDPQVLETGPGNNPIVQCFVDNYGAQADLFLNTDAAPIPIRRECYQKGSTK